MGEPVYPGRVKKFRGSPEQERANFHSHKWDYKQTSSLVKGDYEAWVCSVCDAEVGDNEGNWPCGAPERWTENEVQKMLF